ncbi:MAG TPA: cytochrome d ubiquinol oxidase subunit II [Prolixibacteraceae bacterium]|nr:cytochrome d ubiquinol oxidase subunit II [Prolixibacteraceae bacterium]HPR61699.1 cytochrome d ubiquinol oxidase subunit II [Prolixibacteraceae bacterium]
MMNIPYDLLQEYWWAIISLLGALLVFLMFVQGGQSLIYSVAKNNEQRTIVINALGRKWEFTFTTLVTFGGAFFASFPLFYATSFGGAYWVWMAILLTFILQAVSYEFRSKPANFFGAKVYEAFLVANGLLGTILIGTAVGTFFNGAQFTLNDYHQVTWETSTRGLEAVLNFHNVALGLTVFFLARVLALLYFNNTIEHDEIAKNTRKQLIINVVPFLVFFLLFVVVLLLKDGFAYNPETLVVALEPYKYLHNFLQKPLVLVVFLLGVVLVLWGIYNDLFRKAGKGIWFSGIGTILTVFALFLLAGYNNTCFYPSIADLQSSLHIRNSSSSEFTLSVMSVVSLLVPFVAAYIWIAWRAINNKKIDKDEMKTDTHVY